MVAKLIAWGGDRGEAVARLRRALRDTMVVLRSGTTNQGFLLELLDHPDLRAGDVDNTWLDRLHISGEVEPPPHGDVALIGAAIEISEIETRLERARFYAFARRGRPRRRAGRTHSRAAPRRPWIPLPRRQGGSAAVQGGGGWRHHGERGRAPRCVRAPHRLSGRLLPHGHFPSGSAAPGRGERRSTPGVAGRSRLRSQPRARCRCLHPGRAGRRGGARRGGGRDGEHEDGELARRAVPRARPRRSRAGQRPGGRTGSGRAARADRGGGRAGCCPTHLLREVRRAPAGPRGALHSEARAAVRAGVGLRHRRRRGPPLAGELDALCGDLLGCDPQLVPGEHHLLDVFADLRSLTRRRHDSDDPEGDWLRSRRSTCTATFARSIPRRRGCRRAFSNLSSAPSAITAFMGSSARRRSSVPAIDCSCPRSERTRPGLP